ncbi:Hypothetical_protein [Hexamita inflata]|uniref:Hypothetical_protein n=1 Tax=Hexamita inflata TaxID=28002 RepID=A0ABP1GHF7_9EUKA
MIKLNFKSSNLTSSGAMNHVLTKQLDDVYKRTEISAVEHNNQFKDLNTDFTKQLNMQVEQITELNKIILDLKEKIRITEESLLRSESEHKSLQITFQNYRSNQEHLVLDLKEQNQSYINNNNTFTLETSEGKPPAQHESKKELQINDEESRKKLTQIQILLRGNEKQLSEKQQLINKLINERQKLESRNTYLEQKILNRPESMQQVGERVSVDPQLINEQKKLILNQKITIQELKEEIKQLQSRTNEAIEAENAQLHSDIAKWKMKAQSFEKEALDKKLEMSLMSSIKTKQARLPVLSK